MWGVMWGAPTILKVAVPGFSGRCVTLVCVSARPARCSPNIPTLAEVQPSVRRSLDRLLEGEVIDDANLFSEKLQEGGGLLQLPPPSRRSWPPNTLRAPSSESPRPVAIGLRQLNSRMNERIAPSNDGLTAAGP